jgi:hypothetical protein
MQTLFTDCKIFQFQGAGVTVIVLNKPVWTRHISLPVFVQLVIRSTVTIIMPLCSSLTNRSSQTNNDHVWTCFPPPPNEDDLYDLCLMEGAEGR